LILHTRKRIAVDMDEVLADALGEHLTRYNRDHGESITKADLHGRSLWSIVSADRYARLESYLLAEDFFENLPVIADSQVVLADLAERYEIFIATAAMEFPNSFGPKYRWLRRHFPFLHPRSFVFCGDKSILLADFLIDDMPRNFKNFRGEGILFSAPHNMRITGYRRVNNWRDVAEMFLGKGR
jgi:5'(3')-deoxyribonucleotidase